MQVAIDSYVGRTGWIPRLPVSSNESLARAVEQVAEAIVITDCRGSIEYVNPAFSRMTGYTAQEAIGRTPRMLHSGKQDKQYYLSLWSTILAGRDWNGDLVNRRKDG